MRSKACEVAAGGVAAGLVGVLANRFARGLRTAFVGEAVGERVVAAVRLAVVALGVAIFFR
jgi:hypothetical protein